MFIYRGQHRRIKRRMKRDLGECRKGNLNWTNYWSLRTNLFSLSLHKLQYIQTFFYTLH